MRPHLVKERFFKDATSDFNFKRTVKRTVNTPSLKKRGRSDTYSPCNTQPSSSSLSSGLTTPVIQAAFPTSSFQTLLMSNSIATCCFVSPLESILTIQEGEPPDYYSCASPDDIPLQDLWIKRPPNSKLQYKVVAVDCIPGYIFKTVFEVAVENGVVVGTNSRLVDLFKNEKSNTRDVRQSDSLVFQSRRGTMVFEQNITKQGSPFSVQVTCTERNSRIVLEDMTNELWSRIENLIAATRLFHDCSRVVYSCPSTVKSSDNGLQEVLVTVSMEHFIKSVTSGVEMLETFQSLSVVDQIILLKEGMIGVIILISISMFDNKSNCEVYSAFQNQLLFGINIETLKEHPLTQPVFDAFRGIVITMYDFLQRDMFLIDLLCVVFFLQDHNGLNEPEKVLLDKSMFLDILEKYVRAKIKGKEWPLSYEDIIENLRSLGPLIRTMDECFMRFSSVMEGNLMKKLKKQQAASTSAHIGERDIQRSGNNYYLDPEKF